MQTSLRLAVLVAPLLAAAVIRADDSATVSDSVDDAGDRMPLQTIVPQYPESARRARVEGEVEVCFNVDRAGRTHRVAVRRSTNQVFEKPSKRAVRNSTYRPMPKDKKPSGIKTCRTFRFFLNPVAIETPES